MNKYQHACYVNAKSLLRASKLLFEKRMYGHSAALATLAIEECGKGFLFMIHTPDKKNESFVRNQIKSHKNKLKAIAKDLYLMGLKYEGFVSEGQFKGLEDFQNWVDKKMKEDPRFFILALSSYLMKDLQPLKERGLYVDIENGNALSPKSIKKKTAEFVIEQAERAVKYFPKTYGRKVIG